MLRRFVRSLTMLCVLVAAYQTYALVAVPMMEPPLKRRPTSRTANGERPIESITMYQLLLSNYFPKGHWSQRRPPKVIASSNEQAMLVLDDYVRREDGQVDIKQFALLVFPTPPRAGITPPRDAIILESEKGARLQFDDFRPERGQIGQITRGQFPGRITIRSDMNEPGPDDDLLVETSDLEMNSKLLYTTSPVRFRMGQNIGGGRELEIRFLADEHVKPNDPGLKIAGIDALEIRREVRMRLQLETDSLLPGDDKTGSHASHGNEEKSKPPVEVTCNGPFTFDFVRYVASLDREVNLRQINVNGPSDQLVCNQLDLHFAPRSPFQGKSEPVVASSGERQQRELGRLEPAAIVAEGHPVVLNSPARQAQARGDRIQLVLREQRVRIAGNNSMLIYGPNVLRAPTIEYLHPKRDSSTAIGRFRAAGPGSLHYVLDPAKPQEFFQAVWQTSVELGREKGQPVLALDGRPQLAFVNAGSLTADRMKVYLRELEGNTAVVGLPIADASRGDRLQIAPDRLVAAGRVEIHSPQLTGRTGELVATFRVQPPAPGGDQAGPNSGGVAGPFSVSNAEWDADAFHIESDTMRMEIGMQGQSAQPATLACNGNVVLREVPRGVMSENPLEIRGGQLVVDRIDSGAPYITLRGENAGDSDAAGKKADTISASTTMGAVAQLSGRGVTVFAEVVELDSNDNRMWSDGAGKATLLVTRDLEGRAAAAPFPLDITWQGGLTFDGQTIVFDRQVIVAGVDDTLRCDKLSAKLSSPIKFGQKINQEAIELSEITCLGHVSINHLSRDEIGVTSHERMQLNGLQINLQTGAVNGTGPGAIRSTRFGSGLDALAGAPNTTAPVASPRASGSKLHFLRIDFHSGLKGLIYNRELTFYEGVRTVYGPVDAWEQELDTNRPESLQPDAMRLACDEMRINEDPVAARLAAATTNPDSRPLGPVQLKAKGNVLIDGQTPDQGAFTAQAAQASYEQAKDLFILEGDGRTPATLWRAGQTGAPPQANKITYVRSTGHITIGGIQYFEFTPEDIESARRASPVR